jgi:hypothetical protein
MVIAGFIHHYINCISCKINLLFDIIRCYSILFVELVELVEKIIRGKNN